MCTAEYLARREAEVITLIRQIVNLSATAGPDSGTCFSGFVGEMVYVAASLHDTQNLLESIYLRQGMTENEATAQARKIITKILSDADCDLGLNDLIHQNISEN